jgi:hypothetical protein
MIMNQKNYDWGTWDANTQFHAMTGVPIFTYRAFKNNVEVGQAVFYGHPLLCRSAGITYCLTRVYFSFMI